MGYPLDEAAQNATLDAMLGDNAASTMPSSFEVALFDAHPDLGGAELTSDGGYIRAVVANDSAMFPDAVAGAKTAAAFDFGTATDAFSGPATYALLIDAADSSTRYFAVPLLSPVDVIEAGPTPEVVLVIPWNTNS